MAVRLMKRVPKSLWARCIKIKVSTLDDLERICDTLADPTWVFRGHAKSSWKLCASLDREECTKTQEAERRAINDFASKAGSLIKSSRPIDVLADMQHYGTPTRLIDFSWDFWVALWFAFSDFSDTKSRAVWALNLRTVLEKAELLSTNIEEDVSVIEQIQPMEWQEREGLKESLMEEVFWNQKDFSERVRSVADSHLKATYHKGSGVLPVVWNEDGANERMRAQKGILLLPMDFNGFESNLNSALGLASSRKFDCTILAEKFGSACEKVMLVKIVIPDALRNGVLMLLEKKGIKGENIYPDLVGIAKSVRYQ